MFPGRKVAASVVIELVTLGVPAVLQDGVPLPLRADGPELLLLVRLSLAGTAGRSELAELLWPGDPPEERARRLERTLARLREALGSTVLREEDGRIGVDPGRVRVDVESLRSALAGGRPRDALALCRGPFLEGVTASDFPGLADWIDETRREATELERRARDEVERDSDPWMGQRLLRELRSRRAVHVGLLYLGVAWGSLEVSSMLVEMELLDGAFFVALLAFHLVALPMVLAIAWILEARGRRMRAAALLPGFLRRGGTGAVYAAAALAVLAVGSSAGWLAVQWSDDWELVDRLGAELPDQKHLAVLPFHVVGSDPTARDLADGLMEMLTSQLTTVEGLRGTVSLVPSANIRAREVRSPAEAHRIFGATLAVTGSVRPTRDSLQITVNLVDAVQGRQLDSFVLSEALANLAELQAGTLSGLRSLLSLDLGSTEEISLASGRTEDAQAYALQVRARGYLQRYEREENLDRAAALFREALDRDPTYVLALAGLGEAHKRKYDLTNDPGDLERAEEAVTRALELDERIAQVHVTLGLIRSARGRYAEAENAFRRALELEPHSVDALIGLGDAQARSQRIGEAEAHFRRALDVRPGDWRIHNHLGRVLYQQGRLADAADQFLRVVELTPDNVRGWSNLGAIYFALDDEERAVEALERSLEITPTWGALSNLASYYFYGERDYERAAELYERAVALDERDYRGWYNLAGAYAFLGEEERAAEAFRSTIERARAAQEMNPNDPDILVTLATAHAHLGDFARARFMARQAVELAPDNVVVLFRAGDVHEMVGDRDEAVRLIRAALEGGYAWRFLEDAPGLAELRSDPRLREFRPGDEDEGEVEAQATHP